MSEPSSPDDQAQNGEDDGPSALSNLLRKSPAHSVGTESSSPPSRHAEEYSDEETGGESEEEGVSKPFITRRHRKSSEAERTSEHTPLLRRETTRGAHEVDMEGQKGQLKGNWFGRLSAKAQQGIGHHAAHTFAVAVNPRQWDRKAIWQTAFVTPASCLPAVCVGLLLNILDALSYGKPTCSYQAF